MATVNFPSTYPRVGLAICAASVALALSACSSNRPVSAPSTSTGPASAPAMAAPEPPPATMDRGCPSQSPAQGGPPDWTLDGATGSVAITGSTDKAAPLITVTQPFSVSQTQVRTLHDGDGPVVAPTATVTVCYLGVDGRDGKVFDSAYERGTPAQFSLDGVVPGFQKAIAGQKVGSTVGVAMASADGYPEGEPRAGIQKGDSLVFAIKILSAGS